MIRTWVKEWFEGWTILWRLVVVCFWAWIYCLPLLILNKFINWCAPILPFDHTNPKVIAGVIIAQALLAFFWLPYCFRNAARTSGYVRMPEER